MIMNKDILAKAANEARGLAIDAVHKTSSGHLGLPLGCAEMGAVLFGHSLRFNPDEPRWMNRDRFVLSAGHGSMFLYSWLHLAGYDVTMDDLKRVAKTWLVPEKASTAVVTSSDNREMVTELGLEIQEL